MGLRTQNKYSIDFLDNPPPGGAFVYKCFPPAAMKGLEGECVWL
jgi:hypothetical protein